MPKTRKVCPHCGAPRFLKQDVVEIIGGKEKIFDTLYTCRNQFCQRVTPSAGLKDAPVADVAAPVQEVDLVE